MISTLPTIFHITHLKAGSQWVAEILRQSAPERFVTCKIVDPHAMQGYGLLSFYVEQASWIGAHDVLLLRYENILGNEYIREASNVTKERRRADRASSFSSLLRQRDDGHDLLLARVAYRRSNSLSNRVCCRSKQSNP